MRLYRSIGSEELKALFNIKCPIIGKYHCSNENQNTSNLQNAVCFFVDEIRWKDSDHEFLVVVDIPTTKLEFGIGTYYAAKSLKDTQIWTGRSGGYAYGLREAYAENYSIKDVVELYIFNHFNCSVRVDLASICNDYDIQFYDGHNVETNDAEFIKNKIRFVSDDYNEFDYISYDFSLNREDIVPLSDEERYNQKLLSEVKGKIMDIFEKGDINAVELAEKIKKIL